MVVPIHQQNRINIETSHIIEKGWGEEIIFANNSSFCGKILRYKGVNLSSFHFHLEKHERFYIYSGFFKLTTIDPETAKSITHNLIPGMVIDIRPGVVHQIQSCQAGDIFEVSTVDRYSDTYRIAPGDSQSKKEEL
jgi:mannose-6-phosphate isomerase-like protein (cupin superfamily)